MGSSTGDRTLTAVTFTTLLLGAGFFFILLAGLLGWHREAGTTSHFEPLTRALEIAPLLVVIELAIVIVLLLGYLIASDAPSR